MGMDAASDAAMVTYIGGLHSPPVSQPTAIHQDIQLGEEVGTGRWSLWGGSSQARLAHGILIAQVIHLIASSSAELGIPQKEKKSNLLCPQVLTGGGFSGWSLS